MNSLTKRERKIPMEDNKIEDSKDVVQNAEPTPKADAKEPENAEIVKLKAALSKANAEAADWKRQLREKQSETERAEAERLEREKLREARIAELEAKDRISTYKDKLMEAGIDAAAADLMARSLPEGVKDDYFTAVKTFNTAQREAIETAALNKQPGLSVGMPPTAEQAQKDELNKLRGYAGLPPLP